MAIQIGAKPDSGFDNPIGMLVDCHRRIERFLNLLCTVVERAQDRPLTGEEKQGVQAALAYFRQGGQRHTADEEESLFPRLRASAAAESLAEIGGLEDDHRRANELHAEAERIYTAWIANDALSIKDQKRLLALSRELRHLYAEHIHVEEEQIFPRAATVLDRQTIAAMGSEFRKRRE